ncbi:MAG: hypothetical protein M1814_001824 [Vezdaea aestivalis]|nr:MAG: hypothetical protein M1814_001824 [Vezdaea aestivalis]
MLLFSPHILLLSYVSTLASAHPPLLPRSGLAIPPNPNFLRCHEALPPRNWPFWPAKYRADNVANKPFTSLRALCVAQLVQPLTTAGFYCVAPDDEMRSQRSFADLALWGNPYIMALCNQGCRCSRDLDYDGNDRMSLSGGTISGSETEMSSDHGWPDSGSEDGGASEYAGSESGASSNSVENMAELKMNVYRLPSKDNTCGRGKCRGMSDQVCGGVVGKCLCGAQLIMGLGTGVGKYRGVCRGMFVGLGGRAEMPCACNSTYVSGGCCGASDGMVWERPEARLGVLSDEDEDEDESDSGKGKALLE